MVMTVFSSTVWYAFQLKINKGSQLVLKFSSIWADVAIVCLARTFTLNDISEFEDKLSLSPVFV